MAGPAAAESPLAGLGQAFAMIITSEIGDKTFFIAAILAMRHDRLTVFAGAFGSLLLMSVLSAAMGKVLPSLIPKKHTQFAAAVLFLIFGLKMLREGRGMNGSEKMDAEMQEAEEEIDVEEDDAVVDAAVDSVVWRERPIPIRQLEEGGPHSPSQAHRPNIFNGTALKNKTRLPSPKGRSRPRHYVQNGILRAKADIKRTCRNVLGPVLAQSFLLTFLAEWGDRSQIATIALAAAHSMYLVALGTAMGHACCTALAVIGGRWVSAKISIKHITLCGAVLFLLFAILYFIEAWFSTYGEEPASVHI